MQKEITRGGPLLNEQGMLAEAGWARSLVKTYRREDVKANHLRLKEWDYYLVTDGHRGLALTIADNGYMGMYSASWLDFDGCYETTKSVMTVLPQGKTGLPASSEAGTTQFINDKIALRFTKEEDCRRLYCRWQGFRNGQDLEAEITLTKAPSESMVIMTPYRDDPLAFYYNQKINCQKAEGRVILGGYTYRFDQDAWGVLDWGRGVWTYSNTWYWSSASGTAGGHVFGFNLGYGFGDTTAASENMLFVDGKVQKLERVEFHIPQKEGKDDFMKPWIFTSSDGRFEAVFEPVLNRRSDTNVGIIESDQNQVFGRFTGYTLLDDGEKLEFKDFFGFAEKVKNRW